MRIGLELVGVFLPFTGKKSLVEAATLLCGFKINNPKVGSGTRQGLCAGEKDAVSTKGGRPILCVPSAKLQGPFGPGCLVRSKEPRPGRISNGCPETANGAGGLPFAK